MSRRSVSRVSSGSRSAGVVSGWESLVTRGSSPKRKSYRVTPLYVVGEDVGTNLKDGKVLIFAYELFLRVELRPQFPFNRLEVREVAYHKTLGENEASRIMKGRPL